MYGKITVGLQGEPRDLEIVDFIQATYKDNRVITISEIEDGSYVAAVENLKSSGRNSQSTLWLSKESLIGVISTALLYFNIKGEDMKKLLDDAVNNKQIQYRYSDNLKGDLTEKTTDDEKI